MIQCNHCENGLPFAVYARATRCPNCSAEFNDGYYAAALVLGGFLPVMAFLQKANSPGASEHLQPAWVGATVLGVFPLSAITIDILLNRSFKLRRSLRQRMAGFLGGAIALGLHLTLRSIVGK